MDEEFITIETASQITGLSSDALAQLRYRGGGPKFYKPTSRTVRYRRSEVVAWVDASARTSTSVPA